MLTQSVVARASHEFCDEVGAFERLVRVREVAALEHTPQLAARQRGRGELAAQRVYHALEGRATFTHLLVAPSHNCSNFLYEIIISSRATRSHKYFLGNFNFNIFFMASPLENVL